MVGEGLTTKEIAFALSLSENTVDEHIKKAMTKLGAPNRMRAAAFHRGLQPPIVKSAPSAPQPEGPAYAQPYPQPSPPPVGGGIFPVSPHAISGPEFATTMRLRDGGQTRFEGFPPSPMPPRRLSETEPDPDVQDPLKIISRVFTIAGAIALILVAAPALINGAEHIATWLRLMTRAQP